MGNHVHVKYVKILHLEDDGTAQQALAAESFGWHIYDDMEDKLDWGFDNFEDMVKATFRRETILRFMEEQNMYDMAAYARERGLTFNGDGISGPSLVALQEEEEEVKKP